MNVAKIGVTSESTLAFPDSRTKSTTTSAVSALSRKRFVRLAHLRISPSQFSASTIECALSGLAKLSATMLCAKYFQRISDSPKSTSCCDSQHVL